MRWLLLVALVLAASPAGAQQPLTDEAAVALLRRNHEAGPRIPAGVGLDAAIAALGDPWTRRYDAAAAAAFIAEVSGAADSGVGLPELLSVDLDADGRTPIIVAPVPGSPAARAGLRPRDRIVSVGGVAARELGWTGLMTRLRAPEVRLRVERGGRMREVVLRREPIDPGAATVRAGKHGSALHLEILRFTGKTPGEVRAALEQHPEPKVIVDLRGNPGGDLTACQAVAGLLAGPVELGRMGASRLAATGQALGERALAVLVDEGTASAAELLAAGLHDAAGAPIVGRPTMKKCLVHNGEPLAGGGLLLYTSGRISTTGGASLCDRGVVPDEAASGGPALEAAARRLEGDLIHLEQGKERALRDGARLSLVGIVGDRVAVRLAGEEVDLAPGRPGWASEHRVTLADQAPGPPPRADVVVDRAGDEVLPDTVKVVRVERGQTVALGGRLSLRFLHHGHKMTEPGDTSAPLIVTVELLENGTSLGEHSYNLDLPGRPDFRWRDLRFRLLEHVYDRSMALEVGRATLTRVR